MQEEIIEEVIYQNSLQKRGLVPIIFDGYDLDAPQPFNTLTIHLNGRLQSNLNWKKAKELAEEAISKGFAIFWNIDLGLFSHLSLPIANQTQFLSLGLSLDHFKATLWQEFAEYSVGISLFRGNADFSLDFCWDADQITSLRHWLQKHFQSSEDLYEILQGRSVNDMQPGDLYATDYGKKLLGLFCRDICVEYLSLLASKLPDTIPCYLFLDVTSFSQDLIKQIQLLNPDRFDFLHLALKGTSLPFNSLGWYSHATENGFIGVIAPNIPKAKEIEIGICLPMMNYHHNLHWKGLEESLKYLFDKELAFKLIAENHLISQWDGLNYLLYNADGLSPQGKRKLQGFCAAGGEVVSLGKTLDLPYEISFQQWINEKTPNSG